MFINYKGNKSNLWWRSLEISTLIKWSTWSSIMGQITVTSHWYYAMRKQNHEEMLSKPKWETIYKIIGLYFVLFEVAKWLTFRKRLRNSSRLKVTKRERKLNAVHDPDLDSFVANDIYGWYLNGPWGLGIRVVATHF